MFLYNTFTHVRKGSVNFDLTWRKWVVKLRKWGLYASFTPPLRSLKFLFSCCVTSLKIALFMLHLLVHIVSVRRTYWKKDSWQINSKSSGKSILRRPPKIALTVITVLSFFKHFLLGGLRVMGLTWSRLPQKENNRNYFVNNLVTRFKLNFQWYPLIACVNIKNTYSLNKGLTSDTTNRSMYEHQQTLCDKRNILILFENIIRQTSPENRSFL